MSVLMRRENTLIIEPGSDISKIQIINFILLPNSKKHFEGPPLYNCLCYEFHQRYKSEHTVSWLGLEISCQDRSNNLVGGNQRCFWITHAFIVDIRRRTKRTCINTANSVQVQIFIISTAYYSQDARNRKYHLNRSGNSIFKQFISTITYSGQYSKLIKVILKYTLDTF
ncbi:Hypothetical_protein [Hexamita inflata]|uniref:Hypothetical_protein n=1 Tax=Hexamita inflata TaxID=28002 RepID=A0AA86PYK7_9EUKA|nr:Hypothetical protein HINF_LOCUS34886 [Hexamita inflata]